MRIVAGQYRGRHFDVPRSFKARPTTDFAKENIFNVLRSHIDFEDDAPRALDLFAGTGSITLELLSRGCSSVTAVELDNAHVRMIQQFVRTLGADNAIILKADALRYIQRAPATFDFIFADPPYALPQIPDLPDMVLGAQGLLATEGLFVLEHGSDNDFSAYPALIDHRSYGSVNFSLFKGQTVRHS